MGYYPVYPAGMVCYPPGKVAPGSPRRSSPPITDAPPVQAPTRCRQQRTHHAHPITDRNNPRPRRITRKPSEAPGSPRPRRRPETPRRPRQAPTLANCTPRQQTRTERPETRRNEKRNAYIMKKRRKTAESRNFRKKNKFSSIFIEKTLDNNTYSCYHVIEVKEHTTPTHRRRKIT